MINDIYENEITEELTEEIASEEDTPEAVIEAESESNRPLTDEETVNILREELKSLKNELESTRAAYERLSGECAEFSELYPSIPVTALPDSVWKSFKSGVPLAAAYALYEKKEAVAREKASSVNAKNKELSSGSLSKGNSEEFFSPAEVKAMSAAEVRANYAKIITSMSRWH